eukprot:TRINITY_DN732_c1_g1_i1.p1 TRINITY_DN732_c1_g1~~TRINITY_DN732_c1_g1_i1.p1  ORF type:complete len:347 (+),score=41.09 TRINITY_DN732_c1_g1_i1:349-1389(+)
MYVFTGKLGQFRPNQQSAPKYNLMLFGIAGASKSAFINSALTLLSPDYPVIHSASVGGGEHHNSRKLARFELPGVRATLWDTWGLTPNTYHNGDLQWLLEGVLPLGWDMDWVYDQQRDQVERAAGTRDSRAQHAVLFFIPHSSLDKRDETDLIRSTFDQVKHLNPMLLVTRTDEVDTTIRRSPDRPSTAIIQLKHKASRVLNIPVNRIFTTVNYTMERQKTFAIDRNTYEILDTALGIAEQNYIAKYSQQSLRSSSLRPETTTSRSAAPAAVAHSPSPLRQAPIIDLTQSAPPPSTNASRLLTSRDHSRQPDLSLKPSPKPKFKPDHRPKPQFVPTLVGTPSLQKK